MIRKRWLIITIYVTTLILLYADHNLLSPNLTQISEEFGMTNEQRDVRLGGHISLAFYAVGVPSSFIFGWLSDSIQHRALLFSVAVLIGEIACFLTFFVSNVEMLLVSRSITGIGIGASLPIIYSILGDLFQAEGRNIAAGKICITFLIQVKELKYLICQQFSSTIIAIISSATGLGLGIGQGMAGFLGPNFGWRLPFLLVSIPTFFLAGICCFLEDPLRGGKERSVIAAQEQLVDEPNRMIHNEDEEKGVSYGQVDDDEIQDQSETDEDTCTSPIIHNDIVDCKTHLSIIVEEGHTMNELYPVESASIKSTCNLLLTPTVILLLIQGAPSVLPFGITSTFLNDYLAQDKGLQVEVRKKETFLILYSIEAELCNNEIF
jgi:MFS family permease